MVFDQSFFSEIVGPDDSQYIEVRKNKTADSVYFFKKKIGEINETGKYGTVFCLSKEYEPFINSKPSVPAVKSYIRFAESDKSLLRTDIHDIFQELKSQYQEDEMFGCCHRYNECSKNKRCLIDNRVYSNRCIYKTHLHSGRIFYGENRNVD